MATKETAKCLRIFREGKKITYYQLINDAGQVYNITPDELKQKMKSANITVQNLKLTKDNRIISKGVEGKRKLGSEEELKQLIAKAKLLNKAIEIKCYDGTKCYLVRQNVYMYILYIPDDTLVLSSIGDCFAEQLRALNVRGTLVVIGGKNLIDTGYMFNGCMCDYIDFTYFQGEHIQNMECMFRSSWVKTLDLSMFHTEDVTNMKGMFDGCYAQTIDLSSFRTPLLEGVRRMFRNSKVLELDLSNFDLRKVRVMNEMFAGCHAKKLNVSFKTCGIISMAYMFWKCVAKELDLSTFDTKDTAYMDGMFEMCQAEKIYLGSFNTEKCQEFEYMFRNCQTKSLDLSTFYLDKVTKTTNMFKHCKAREILVGYNCGILENVIARTGNMAITEIKRV